MAQGRATIDEGLAGWRGHTARAGHTRTGGMMDRTVTVSIGRNVGSTPMPAVEWDDCRRAVLDLAFTFGAVHFRGSGIGEYDGVQEESYTVVFTMREEYRSIDF